MHSTASSSIGLQLSVMDHRLSESGADGMDRRGSMHRILKRPGARRSSVAQVPDYADAHRASVLQFAWQVTGTGLTKDMAPRQSMYLKQLEEQVAEVAPVLQHMQDANTAPGTEGCTTSCVIEPSNYIHEEIESLHDKMDQITESLAMLAREVGQTKSVVMYTSTYSQVHRSGTLPALR